MRIGIAAFLAIVAGMQGGVPIASAFPDAETVTRLADFPNRFSKFDAVAHSASWHTFLLSDPVSHLLIEVGSNDWGSAYPQSHDCSPAAPSAVTPGFAAEWVEYNPDTSTPIAATCGLPSVDGQATVRSFDNTGPDIQTAVVDSADGLVFVPCLCGSNLSTSEQIRTIMAVSEHPLQIAGDFCVIADAADPCTPPTTANSATGSSQALSQSPYPYLQDLSWYGGTADHPADDLIALSDNYQNRDPVSANPDYLVQEPLGVAVTDYHIEHDATGALSLRLQWTIHLGPNVCQRALTGMLGQLAAADRTVDRAGDQSLFVPCTTASASSTTVVKVPLQATGQPAGDPGTDPTVKVEPLVAPFPGQDFLFDPTAERGYLLPQIVAGDGLSVAVYDGGARKESHEAFRPASFLGRIQVSNYPLNAFALDLQTGRLYVDDSLEGRLQLIDGRRTPLSPGRPFSGLFPAEAAGTYQAVAVPPDPAYPYTRVFLPNTTGADQYHDPIMSNIKVVADRAPVSANPPAGVVDSTTYGGAIAPGAIVSTTYAGHAAGYGVQADLVGGYLAPVDNTAARETTVVPPAARDTVDLHAGSVQSSTLQDGSAQAKATALADANGNAARAYHSCSDALSPQSCMALQCPIPLSDFGVQQLQSVDPCAAAVAAEPTNCAVPQTAVDPCNTASTTTTSQGWPYPGAECSQPGPSDKEGRQSASGFHYTPVRSTDSSATPSATPTPQPSMPQTESASAVADCSNGANSFPQVTAVGRLGCTGAASPPAPDSSSLPSPPAAPDLQCADGASPITLGTATLAPALTVTNAYTQTLITSPSSQEGVVESSVTAVAQGLHLDLGDGATLDIAQATQRVLTEAGGRPGTAHTTRTVTLEGVVLQRPGFPTASLCVQPDTCSGDQGLLDQINTFDPSHLYATLPEPDEPFGTEPDGVSPAGSPGGYQAKVEASVAEQQGDALFNGISGFNGDGTEKTLLPALRLILNAPGSATVSRLIVDLAGVEADTELGVQVFQDDTGMGTPTVDATQSLIQAGVPPVTYQPGTAGTPGFPGQPAPAAYHSGLLGVLERALSGLGWLVRSPLAGLQMAGFLVLLGLPVLLVRRRWTWQPDLREEG